MCQLLVNAEVRVIPSYVLNLALESVLELANGFPSWNAMTGRQHSLEGVAVGILSQ